MARISMQHLSRLCHNLGTGLHAGLDIRRLLETQSQEAELTRRTQLVAIRDRIGAGESLAEAFRAANGYFPPLFCEMVEVGERTGRLEMVFFRLAEYYDQIIRLRRNFLAGIAWPLFELTLGILAIGGLIYILGAIGAEWEGEKIGVFGLQGGTGALIWFSGAAAVALAIAGPIWAASKGWINLDPVMRLLIRLPGIGTGLRIFALSRLTWSLAIATDSDLPSDRAVELAVRSTQNGYYTDSIEQMKLGIRRGEEIHDVFRLTGIYPPEFLDALQTGEISGRISETMMVLGKQYDERAKMWYRGLAAVCGFLVFLLVAGLMIFMIINLFMSMYMKPIQDTLDSM